MVFAFRSLISAFACLIVVLFFRVHVVYSQVSVINIDDVKKEWWKDELHQHSLLSPVEARQSQQMDCDYFPHGWWGVVSQSIAGSDSEILYRKWCESTINLTNNPSADVHPYFNKDGSRIFFASDRQGNYDIYVMNATGGEVRQLTNGLNDEIRPVWSSQGKIAYSSSSDAEDSEIWVMNEDGTAHQQLTTNNVEDVQPTWFPDGSRVVWVQVNANGDTGELWQMNADGSNQSLLAGPFRYLAHPNISPDGSRIVFDADLTGDYANDFAVINADGSNLATLMIGSVTSKPINEISEYWASGWYPDGSGATANAVTLRISDSSVQIYYVGPHSNCFSSECGSMISFANKNELFPKIVHRDPYPPVSQLLPMPEFSRYSDMFFSWNASDRGEAGIASFELQYREEGDTIWKVPHDFPELIPGISRSIVDGGFSSAPAYFRIHAIDNVGNIEPYPQSNINPVKTYPFAGFISGMVTDGRGIPMVDSPVNLLPTALTSSTTNAQGDYLFRLAHFGDYLLGNHSKLNLLGDYSRNLYLSPADSILQDGGFETSNHSDWILQHAQLISTTVSSGNQSLLLGTQCESLCMKRQGFAASASVPKLPPDQVSGVFPALIGVTLTSSGKHLYALGKKVNQVTLYFSELLPNGDWSSPLPMTNDPLVTNYWIVARNDELVHVFWLSTNGSIQYSKRTGANWSAAQPIANGFPVAFAAAPGGGIHLLFVSTCELNKCTQSEKLQHRYVAADGTLSSPKTLLDKGVFSSDAAMNLPSVAATVGDDGTLHLIYDSFLPPAGTVVRPVSQLTYQMLTSQGSWTPAQLLKGIWGQPRFLKYDENNKLHFIYFSSNMYYVNNVSGQWSEPFLLGENEGFWNISSPNPQSPIFVWRHGVALTLPPGSDRSYAILQTIEDEKEMLESQISLWPYSFADIPFAVTAPNQLNAIIWEGAGVNYSFHLTTETISESVSSSASQSVTISTTLHQPTLSFLYAVNGSSAGQSYFDVSISSVVSSTHRTGLLEGSPVTSILSTTRVFSTTAASPWQLGWIDMLPWQGKAVTVTFSAHQVVGDTPLQVYVDEVALGSWTTPVPLAISPTKIDSGKPTTMVITGENFIETPIVKLGEFVMSDVRLVDETRLEVIIPDKFSPGVYPVILIGKQGQSATAPMMFAVGKQTFLPLITR